MCTANIDSISANGYMQTERNKSMMTLHLMSFHLEEDEMLDMPTPKNIVIKSHTYFLLLQQYVQVV